MYLPPFSSRFIDVPPTGLATVHPRHDHLHYLCNIRSLSYELTDKTIRYDTINYYYTIRYTQPDKTGMLTLVDAIRCCAITMQCEMSRDKMQLDAN